MTNPVTILNPATLQSEDNGSGIGNSAQSSLIIGPYTSPALILMTGQGEAKYSAGGPHDAGIFLVLKVNGAIVGKDDSFEGESSNMTFMASAAHNFMLPLGATVNVEANVDHLGIGGIQNTNTKVNLKCFALATG